MFFRFLPFESCINGVSAADEWLGRGFIPVAECAHSGAVLLGTRETEADVIFIQTMSGRIVRIADSIFEFTRNLVMMAVPENELMNGLRYDQFYKNWGENFWRVRV